MIKLRKNPAHGIISNFKSNQINTAMFVSDTLLKVSCSVYATVHITLDKRTLDADVFTANS